MKKSKIANFLIGGLFSLGALTFMTSCDDITATKISTFEELKNANGSIVLENDIDCEFETIIKPINVTYVNGNNHKIKNLILTNDGVDDPIALFNGSYGNNKATIKDIDFENVTVKSNAQVGASVVAGYGVKQIKNVNVTNSTIETTQACSSGITKNLFPVSVGFIHSGLSRNSNKQYAYSDVKIENCTVKGSSITVKPFEGNKDNSSGTIYAGLIAGLGSASNSHVSSSSLKIESKAYGTDMFAGGIIGKLLGEKLDYCSVRDSEITSYNTNYSSTFAGINGSTEYVGGIVGATNEETKSAELSHNEFSNSKIDAVATGVSYVGGIAGTSYASISQSLSRNNEISVRGQMAEKESRGTGGIAGLCSNSSISTSISRDNDFIDDCETQFGFVGGIAGSLKSSSIVFSAAGNNTFDTENGETRKDELSPQIENSMSCFVRATENGNINNCDTIDEEDFNDLSYLKSEIGLSSSWRMSGGLLRIEKDE